MLCRNSAGSALLCARGSLQRFSSSRTSNLRSLATVQAQRSSNGRSERVYLGMSAFSAATGAALLFSSTAVNISQVSEMETQDEENMLLNWSENHTCRPHTVYFPESVEEASRILAYHHENRRSIRCIGSGLSPNGLSFVKDGNDLINMALCDRVLDMDTDKQQVTVQSGMVVGDLLKVLKQNGMTLQNVASIREQQIGGVLQAGCHGTGARIPPMEEQIVSMKILTPAKGLLTLSTESNPEIFKLAKCGLGALGIVTEVTLQCKSRHLLREQTTVCTVEEIKANHTEWLSEYQHLRYMWIPHSDKVVVVKSNPYYDGDTSTENPIDTTTSSTTTSTRHGDPCEPLRRLLLRLNKQISMEQVRDWPISAFRDHLIALNPLDAKHIKEVNHAEAQCWARSEGIRIADSDEIVGFDCGGQQLVLEVAFSSGSVNSQELRDVEFVQGLLRKIEQQNLPAPAPIEQRWTASSTSSLSPAFSNDKEEVFSWVGIISYLPTKDPCARASIEHFFHKYSEILHQHMKRYNGIEHWAKVEISPCNVATNEDLSAYRAELRCRYNQKYGAVLKEFRDARKVLDPHHLLANEILDTILQ